MLWMTVALSEKCWEPHTIVWLWRVIPSPPGGNTGALCVLVPLGPPEKRSTECIAALRKKDTYIHTYIYITHCIYGCKFYVFFLCMWILNSLLQRVGMTSHVTWHPCIHAYIHRGRVRNHFLKGRGGQAITITFLFPLGGAGDNH